MVLKKHLEDRGLEVTLKRRLKHELEIKEISDNSDLIIYAAFVNGHMPKGGAMFFNEECETFFHAFTHGKEKTIGISCGSPYLEHDIMENANTFVNLYGTSPDLMQAFVEGIFGEIPFVGKSPVKLKPPKFIYED